LQSGLSFNADVTKNPWWTLSAPVAARASLDLAALDLASPSLGVYQHSFVLATSGGPFAPGSPTPVGPTPPPSPAPAPTPSTVFDGGPGTAAPPATLGTYTLHSFPTDGTPPGTAESAVLGPTGTIMFDGDLTHDSVGHGWATWSNGYTGDVYEAKNKLSATSFEVTISLPPNTGAFYLYAEPNEFEDLTMSATSDDGTTSGNRAVFGNSGAQYFGFYVPCGHSLSSIEVQDMGGDSAMAIGEFGIASGCSPAPTS
jgi:hypothetical protein